ncbi:MAG: DNA starvation/stationary phase protection protein [Bacteroidia bacterium]|nr:DNA starvation/stationary phase protection protein [Bacteroidia bacterium]NNF30511.1 DNA starvation/stationary phase protection protein [Flavobacteriaceae bacterium]MBT8276511.1 DNA starvation/stationary phase protection protein [Bacteroidia bacterium]NNJ82230.1 DNA starvation/stationary phase protection protein [Flavobacteriaceae bacterium]NNK53841.1 DNA starvation/stationary phase protection protein [Flavobacteriaceae bacterium]
MTYLNLDTEKTNTTAHELNILLADFHIYYQKLRNFHWNVVGSNFFDLHAKFEEMYDDAKLKVDEVAERILTLRFQPLSNYSDYLKKSNLKESESDLNDVEMVKTLIGDHALIISQMRKVIDKAGKANDEGTIDLIGSYVAEIEKTSWMLDAWTMQASENHPKL